MAIEPDVRAGTLASPAGASDVRRHNLALVLRALAAGGTQSRAELAESTGLTRSTVGSLVAELLELRLVVELGVQSGGKVGRPGSVLAVNGDLHCGVGLEINVDYLSVCVTDLIGRVRVRLVRRADNRGVPEHLTLDRAVGLLVEALGAARQQSLRPVGVAVALPGMVNAGWLLLAPNLGWRDIPVVDEVRRRLAGEPLPVVADNEANLAALGEYWYGIGAQSGDYVHVSGEIGIGAGVVIDGRLFRGARGLAGELGHIIVERNGLPCTCGARGCLEQYTGQEALLRQAGLATKPATNVGGPDTPMAQLIDRLRSGDRRALDSIGFASEILAAGLTSTVRILNPDTIILGGIFAALAPWLVGSLQQQLADQARAGGWEPVSIRFSELGPDAAVRGAAGLIVDRILAAPGPGRIPASQLGQGGS